MRSAVIAAAFAAGALAVPYQKRAIETDTDVVLVYATELVTVTAGVPSTEEVAPETTSLTFSKHGHRWRYTTTSSTTVSTSTTVRSSAAPSSVSVAPSSSSTRAASTSTSTSAAAATSAVSTRASSSSAAAATSAASTRTTSTSAAVSSAVSTRASSTSTVATTSAATSANAAAVPTTYQQIAVYHHNIHRANHSAADVVWDAGLASTAATIAASCNYAHNVQQDGGGYGQNIAAGLQANNISAIITELFYNGEVGWFNGLYGQAQPDMTNFEHWGHFSQIVWKDTTRIGCATQDCSATGLTNVGSNVPPYFTVCNYKNPGNYANEYGLNIGSPLGQPTARWNTGLSV